VKLTSLALHAILTFSDKSYLKSQFKGISPRFRNGSANLAFKCINVQFSFLII
jgi:hypothetical protein